MRQSRTLLALAKVFREDLGSNPDMIELALLGTQARLDVAQAFAIGELGKDHAQILIPAGKSVSPCNGHDTD